MATGTHGWAFEACHRNRCHSGHETVRSDASGCESGVHHGAPSAHEKVPPGSGRADSSKRVRRFERPHARWQQAFFIQKARSSRLKLVSSYAFVAVVARKRVVGGTYIAQRNFVKMTAKSTYTKYVECSFGQ